MFQNVFQSLVALQDLWESDHESCFHSGLAKSRKSSPATNCFNDGGRDFCFSEAMFNIWARFGDNISKIYLSTGWASYFFCVIPLFGTFLSGAQ